MIVNMSISTYMFNTNNCNSRIWDDLGMFLNPGIYHPFKFIKGLNAQTLDLGISCLQRGQFISSQEAGEGLSLAKVMC